jgi:choloylglycine hydrolase
MKKQKIISAIVVSLFIKSSISDACTGISLKAADQTVVVARTVEWALGDAQHNRLVVFPRAKGYVAQTPDGLNGMKWTGKYGFVFVSGYGQNYGPDGLNEEGLYVGMYYLPGFADFQVYKKADASKSMSVGDYMQWMLSSFKTVKEVRNHLNDVIVVNVADPRFGGVPLPFHWKISDPSGESMIIEIVEGGKVKTYDAFRGVITNSPTYDWHLTNLRNYIHLSSTPSSPIEIDKVKFTPLGGGSGLVGLPGDFTPPSRFVRAAVLTSVVRPLATGNDAVFEAFRILDSFNITVGATGSKEKIAKDIESATQITSASDLKNRVYYYHTMYNRRIRKIDLKKIDFSKVKQQVIDDDADHNADVKELVIAK